MTETTGGPRAHRRRWARRVRALLAGGLVLGIGSAATVAAWTDTESATGSFAAGKFGIELSVDQSWSSSRTMTFNASAMYPGNTVYAPVYVRTRADAMTGGQLTVSAAGATGSAGGIADSLTYRAVTASYATAALAFAAPCNATAFAAGATYVFGSSSSSRPMRTAFTSSTKQTVKSVGGSVQAYCFEVVLPTATPNGAQGTSASQTWKFDAESLAPA